MCHMAAWIAPSLSISIKHGWAIPTRIYRNNSQFYIIQVFEFPLKIFNVLGAALLYYYWLILQQLHHSAAEPDKSAQTLHIDRRPKIWILFSRDYGNSLGKSQQQASQTDKPERTHLSCTENTAVAVCKTLVPQLTATRESVSQGISMSCSSACGWISNTMLKVNCHAQSFPVLNWKTGQNPKYLITDHYYLEGVITFFFFAQVIGARGCVRPERAIKSYFES